MGGNIINNLKYTEKIKRNILNDTFDMAALVFGFLIDLGEMTVETFLNPSLYADLPSGNLRFSLKNNKPKEATIKQTINRMQKHGLIKKEGGKYVLTLIGKNITKYILGRKKVFEKKWDKKYRVVIFDIPEKKKHSRDWLREELYLLKYEKLQESVLVGKFPLPKDLIREIKNKKINKFVDYLLVEKIYSKLDD
jgi:DNA-binding transcriptional regulator PaaX